MDYKTYPPGIELNSIVKCYWTLKSPKEPKPQKQRIIPDGCMEMIFHQGDDYKQYLDDETSIIQPKCFVFGQIISSLEIEPTGVTDIFAVRFHPEGFIPFASIPLRDMENRAVPLIELFAEDGLSLGAAILTLERTEDKIACIENFLTKRLSDPAAIDRTVQATVQEIMSLKGQGSIDELSKKMSVNRRRLERKFASVIGLSPKQLSKIIRLHTALRMIQQNKFNSLTSVAHESDYYDQAHFIRDFKEFTGLSPKQFYTDNLKMSALFHSTE